MKVLDMAVVIVVMLEALGLALSVRVVKQYQSGCCSGWAVCWGRGGRDCTASCR